MNDITHADAQLALPELALDALDGSERDVVLAHVRGCDDCQRELASLQEAMHSAAEAVPARQLEPARAAAMRERLVDRARASRGLRIERGGAPTAQPVRPAARPSRSVAQLVPLAAAVLLAVFGASQYSRSNRLSADLDAARSNADQLRLRVSENERELAQRTAMIDALTGPGVQVMSLSASGVKQPMARMFWDQRTNRWTMVVHNMPKPAAGRTYQVWLVTASKKISAGTFEPSASGDAMMQAVYALSPSELKAVAVTEEPVGGMPQPTGRMVIISAD